MSEIKPIETVYKGYRFRSRLEARWAVFFDALGIEWEYEPEGFVLPNGMKYLPDFRLKCWATRGLPLRNTPFDLYVEVKGEMSQTDADKILSFVGLKDYEDICVALCCGDCEGDYVSFCPKGFHHERSEFVNPVLILGAIPSWDRLGYSLNSWSLMNDIADMYQFNYRLIDGDNYEAIPVSLNGKLYLTGADYLTEIEKIKITTAFNKARSARFEHGESGPAVPAYKGYKHEDGSFVYCDDVIAQCKQCPHVDCGRRDT